MASLDTGGGDGGHKKGPGVKKAKKLSTRVDMTPMVDLGFLLITFFIFTSTMSTPTTLALNMPKDEKDPLKQNEAKESGALSIMLGKNDQVYYYEGQLVVNGGGNNFKSTNFKGIRDVIIDKKKAVIAAHQHDAQCDEIRKRNNGDPNSCRDRDLVVVIKPDKDATYKNTVDMLDEMTINGVKRYALVDIVPEEEKLIAATEGSAPAQ
ncbi:MAG TPA: biopolymer transporter ExbD [Chitinophagaceae bacterium]|nr:biopolymer transporter ExbD [Chitinophagaceae bacterium]